MKRLCFGCLSDKHVARDCPVRKPCKITNCTRSHPTVLHTPSREKPTIHIAVGTDRTDDISVLNAMANTDECPNEVAGEVRSKTAIAIIPVKLRSRATKKTVITYAFLDSGSSASFCTESLMKKLGVSGPKVKISLSTLEKRNSLVDSYLVHDLVVSDLDGNDFVKLHVLYSRPKIPVSKEDIPTQGDIDLWPHLNGVFIPRVDADTGLLIASDIPEALDPVEIRHSEHAGPYTSRTRIGWAVNGPLRRSPGGTRIVSSFIKADPQLQQMVQDFYNRDFVDLFFNDTTEMSQDKRRFMRNTEKIKFKDGHNEIALLFKSGFTSIPNNKSQALTWNDWLKKKLMKDPKLRQDYKDFMSELVAKGYARKVPLNQAVPEDGKVYTPPRCIPSP